MNNSIFGKLPILSLSILVVLIGIGLLPKRVLTQELEKGGQPPDLWSTCHLAFADDQDEGDSRSQYERTLAQLELTPGKLRDVDLDFRRRFIQASLRTDAGEIVLKRQEPALLRSLFQLFTLAVSRYIVGYNKDSNGYVRAMAQTLASVSASKINLFALEKFVRQTAEDPTIFQASVMAPYLVKQSKRSVESSFLKTLGKYSIDGGPIEAEMVRAALQFLPSPRAGDRILEIGSGAAAVVAGYNFYAPEVKLKAVNPEPLPELARELFRDNLEYIQGIFPDEEKVREHIHRSGPYHAILALDTIKVNNSVGARETRSYPTQLTGFQLFKELALELGPGGVLIILNDFRTAVPFEAEQINQAEFQVVRWNALRKIPDPLRPFLNYHEPRRKKAGEFSLYVFRRGVPDQSRLTLNSSNG